MGFVDITLHGLAFLAPALFVGGVVAMVARWVMPNRPSARGFIESVAINFIAGAVALGIGLWVFGRDGKMASYAALVLTCACSQWWLRRGR